LKVCYKTIDKAQAILYVICNKNIIKGKNKKEVRK